MRLPAYVSTGRIPRTALLVLLACGGGPMRSNEFSVDWQDDRGLSIGRIWAQTSTVTAPASADVVVGIAEPGDRIVALSLASGNKWAFAHALAVRPVVAGPLVVAALAPAVARPAERPNVPAGSRAASAFNVRRS